MNKETRRKLVLFDFDGTLTAKDTLFELIKYVHGKRVFYVGLCRHMPSLLLYLLKIMSAQKAKERILTYFFKGFSIVAFEETCRQFALKRVPHLLRPDALRTLEQWQIQDADVIVVTASAENWVRPWCEIRHIGCIATRLEVSGGRLTGKIIGRNCNGEEKVARIRMAVDLTCREEIIAYGNGKGDLPMLDLANQAYYRIFKC